MPGEMVLGDPHEDLEDLQKLEAFFLRADTVPEPEMDGPEL